MFRSVSFLILLGMWCGLHEKLNEDFGLSLGKCDRVEIHIMTWLLEEGPAESHLSWFLGICQGFAVDINGET